MQREHERDARSVLKEGSKRFPPAGLVSPASGVSDVSDDEGAQNRRHQGRPRPGPDAHSNRRLVASAAAAAATTATTAETATAAATTTRATTAATRAGTILRLIDLQRATAHVDAIEILDGTRRVGLAHLNEAKAARTSSVAIDRKRHRLNRTVSSEQGADLFIRSSKGKIPNVNFSHVNKNSNITSKAASADSIRRGAA